MDQNRFQEAQAAYDAGDYRAAAKAYLSAAGRGPEGNGAAYHMAGNSLMRLRRYQDAITVYGHALRDSIYDKRGAVYANLGAAYSALGEYAESVKAYEDALNQSDYATPFKAYQGMANALLERGRVEDAAVAYRKAALDPGNPDPGKALVNLGLCFMALGRPADAVEAYQAALGFDQYAGRGKALANLGQAYVALGEYDEACRSFEKATELHNHDLSPAALAAWGTARAHSTPPRDVVEGWETGELPQVKLPDDGSSADWSTADFVAVAAGGAAPAGVENGRIDFDSPAADHAADSLGFGDDAAVADFFSVTDEQLKQRDRELRRATKSGRGWVRPTIIVAVLVVVLAAVLGGAYYYGFGFPTQQQTVSGLLEAHGAGESVDSYWVAVPSKDVAKEMAKVPPLKSFTIDGVQMDPQTSTVAVTVVPKTGAPLHYTITLAREGVGWKVSGVENDWRTTPGGS